MYNIFVIIDFQPFSIQIMRILQKISVALTAMTVLSAAAVAQEDQHPVVLSITHPDGIYSTGEKIDVTAESTADFEEGLLMDVVINGKTVTKKGQSVSLKVGTKTVIYSGSWDEATSVRVSLKKSGEKNAVSNIGFVVKPEDFRPGFEDPKDFDKFWAAQLKSMRKSKMKPVLKPYELTGRLAKYADKCECYSFEINMPEGRPARGFIALPKDAVKKSLPIVMHFHGAGYSISNVNNAVMSAANMNAISIDMNAHGYEDVKEIADELGKTELKDYRCRPVTDHKSFYYRLMFLRDVRALDYAVTRPEWDGKRILVKGGSQGGGQSLAVAAIDNRVTAVFAEVPALTDMGGNFSNHSGSWPGYYRSMKRGDNLENELAVLPYYDGATFARHIKAEKVWIEAGLVDSTCPPDCVISAFNVIPASVDKTLYTFPYRQHTTRRFDKEEMKLWKSTIDTPRMAEIKEYLK